MALVKGSNISIEPFDGRGKFTLWKQRVKSLMTWEGTIKALKVKTRTAEKMTNDEWVTSREDVDGGVAGFEGHGNKYKPAMSCK